MTMMMMMMMIIVIVIANLPRASRRVVVFALASPPSRTRTRSLARVDRRAQTRHIASSRRRSIRFAVDSFVRSETRARVSRDVHRLARVSKRSKRSSRRSFESRSFVRSSRGDRR